MSGLGEMCAGDMWQLSGPLHLPGQMFAVHLVARRKAYFPGYFGWEFRPSCWLRGGSVTGVTALLNIVNSSDNEGELLSLLSTFR